MSNAMILLEAARSNYVQTLIHLEFTEPLDGPEWEKVADAHWEAYKTLKMMYPIDELLTYPAKMELLDRRHNDGKE